jgi:hypothetical protein
MVKSVIAENAPAKLLAVSVVNTTELAIPFGN